MNNIIDAKWTRFSNNSGCNTCPKKNYIVNQPEKYISLSGTVRGPKYDGSVIRKFNLAGVS